MPLEVKRQRRESAQSLVRRFTKRLRRSGILRRAKDIRYRHRPKSKALKKRSALRREQLKKQYEKLRKMGTHD